MIRSIKWCVGMLAMLMAMAGTSGAAPSDITDCNSAIRPEGTTSEDWRAACMSAKRGDAILGSGGAVVDAGVIMSAVDFTAVPTWTDAQIVQYFTYTRDLRYLYDEGIPSPGDERRITWLYPDDGCYARAEQVVGLISDADSTLAKPYKLWAFDQLSNRLEVYTENAYPSDHVNWWYHVVPLVKNSAGEPIVLDAAINPCGPLHWQAWLDSMIDDVNRFNDPAEYLQVAVSDYWAYGPYDDVWNDDNIPDHRQASLELEQDYVLDWEWDRQVNELGHTPADRFGDNPDWLVGCEPLCGDDSDCDDGNACTDDICNINTFNCEHTAVPDEVYEAETDMYHDVGNTYADGWNIHSNGYISFWHTFSGGLQDMTVSAAGSYAGWGWPNMRVDVNNIPVYSTEVNTTTWSDYDFSFAAPSGTYEVRIYFTNDYYGGSSNDRNLYIDKATMACGGGGSGAPINLGAVNSQNYCTVNGTQDLIIDQLSFGWTPSKIVVGFAATDNMPLNGVTVAEGGNPAVALSGDWDTIEITFTNQPVINLTVSGASRALRTERWAQ